MFLRALVVCLVVLGSVGAATATVDPNLFRDLRWRLVGPFRGGRVLAVSGVPGEPSHFYFGSVDGGVWETNDAGRTWQPIFDDAPIGSIGALAVAPSRHSVIYVGSGEADMRSDIAQGDGMYKSVDAGRSWTKIGLADTQQIAKILVDPTDPETVFVAALGHPYAANAERGVFRSTDGGTSWRKVLGPNDDTGAIDLAFEPGNSRVVYASLWQTRRTPWNVYPPSSGPGSGLYKSTDAGETWARIDGNGFAARPGRIGIAVAPSAPKRLYAIVDAQAGGLYRSDDGGASWNRSCSDPRVWSRGWYFGGITVEPNDPDVVYSCNVNLYRSSDGGKTFVPVKGAPGGDDYHSLWIDPQSPERRILGVDQGCVVSVNGGRTWSSWYNQPTGQFYHCITDDRFPYWIYGSQQDSGAAGVPSRTSTYDGITLSEFREVTAGGESDNIAPDPDDPETLYGGRVDKLDTRTGQTKSVDPMLPHLEEARETWTLPLVFSHRDPKVLYFANQRVYRTDDGGNHWSTISPDLTREDPGVPANLDATTANLAPRPGTRHGVVYAIAPSRTADHDIWVGTDDGQIWHTADEGAHWANVTPAALTPWSKVGIVDASHFDAATAYAAVDRHRLDDARPYIYRTHDGGRTWTPIANGIPDGSFVNVVREDSARRGLLYAGTEKGVYVSFDDGDHWQSLQLNLPVSSVRDIDVHGDDLVIATHGRAFWVLDDVTPLRQVDAATSIVEPRLFEPAVAIRMRSSGFTGTPMPKDEALAPNPPSGAIVDYVVPPGNPVVTLEVLDARGSLVRRYSTADATPTPNLEKLRTAPDWFDVPSTLASSAGMHRFVWPLRYPALGGKPFEDGIWAPPGAYTIALTVGGRRLTATLRVEPDPRVHVAANEYLEQFAFGREVEATAFTLTAALREARLVADRIAAIDASGSSDLASALKATLDREADVAGVAATGTPSNDRSRRPASTTSMQFVSEAVAKISASVDGADGAPTKDARDGWAIAKPAALAALRAWDDFKHHELATLNERLVAAGREAIDVK